MFVSFLLIINSCFYTVVIAYIYWFWRLNHWSWSPRPFVRCSQGIPGSKWMTFVLMMFAASDNIVLCHCLHSDFIKSSNRILNAYFKPDLPNDSQPDCRTYLTSFVFFFFNSTVSPKLLQRNKTMWAYFYRTF